MSQLLSEPRSRFGEFMLSMTLSGQESLSQLCTGDVTEYVACWVLSWVLVGGKDSAGTVQQ